MYLIDVIEGATNRGQWQFEAMPGKGDSVEGPKGMHIVQQVIHRPGVGAHAPKSGIIISPPQ